MKTVFKILTFAIFPFQTFAQNNDLNNWKNFGNYYDNLYKPIKKIEILNASYLQNLSTAGLNNKFLYPFIFNKNLEKNAINANLKNDKYKRTEIESYINFSYINLKKTPFKNKNIFWLLNGAYSSKNSIKMSNDAAKLIFEGNTDSAKYILDDCYLYNLRFNKVGAGIFMINEKSYKPYNFSFVLNVLQIQNFTELVSYKNNYLKSNEDSFEIGLNYDATFASSKLSGFNGMGLSADFNLNYKVNKNSILSFKIQDLGFAKFKNSANFYTSNNVYKFDGIHIPDISILNDNTYFKSQVDSTVNLFSNKQEKIDKTLFIAPQIEIAFTTRQKSGFYTAAIRKHGTKNNTELSLRYFNFIKPNIVGGISSGYLNSIFINTDASFAFKNKFFIQFGLKHIEALLLPSKFGGLGINAGFQVLF